MLHKKGTTNGQYPLTSLQSKLLVNINKFVYYNIDNADCN